MELALSNDDLNNLIQSTEIDILFLDAQLNIRRYTPGIKRILDLVPHDIGRNLSHFRAKIQLGDFMEHVESVLETLVPYESSIKDIKGKEYLLKINPFRTNRNEIKGVVLVFVDLTQVNEFRREIQLSDRALSDLKLKHANQTEILELISENLNDMVLIIDQKGNIEYCTPSASTLTGYSYEQLLNMNFFSKVTDSSQLAELTSAINGFSKNQQSGLIEFELLLKNGKNHWFEANLKPINRTKEDGFKLLMTVRDVQERHFREAEYQRNALIAEQTGSSVIMTDTNGKIISINKAFEKLTGYLEDEVIGKKPGEFLQGEESDPAVKMIMSDYIKNRQAFDVNIINYSKLGHKYFINIKAEPLYDKLDNFIGFFSIQNDISKEQEQLTHIQTLNLKIKDQVSKLAEANTALEEFAYVASHDLKTPVRNIKGLLDIIKKKGDDLDEKKKEAYFDIVTTSATELNKMIENLLEYSRNGNIQEPLEEVDSNVIIKAVTNQFDADLKALNGNISVEVEIPTITVYPILFKRLLTNLISNAIKYSGDKPPKIQLSCKTGTDSILFSMEDNGIGVPENQFENIFKIFKSLNPNKDSNGIGLSVCKKIVELHGGEIWLDSKLGESTTFYFTIPKP